MSDQIKFGLGWERIKRLLGCALILFLPVALLVRASADNQIPNWKPLLLLALYLFVGGCLVAYIFGQLYKQHKLTKFRINLNVIFAITVAVILPIGVANLFWELFEFGTDPKLGSERIEIVLVSALGLALLYIPIFFMAEALFSVLTSLRQQSIHEPSKPRGGPPT